MAVAMITATLWARGVMRMVVAVLIALEPIRPLIEAEDSGLAAEYTTGPGLHPGRSITITEPLEASAIRSPIADSAILVRATECAPVRSVVLTSAGRPEAFRRAGSGVSVGAASAVVAAVVGKW